MLAQAYLNSGYDIQTFYCPMAPTDKLEHLYIPQTNTFFTTHNTWLRPTDTADASVIDLNQYVDVKSLDVNISIDLEMYHMQYRLA